MNDFSMNNILSYICMYGITFVICLFGCFVKDLYETIKKNSRINILKIFISAVFVSFILCAVKSYVKMELAVYIFISFFSGLWGFVILENAFNIKIVTIIIKNIFKRISNPIFKGLSDSIEEIKEEEKKTEKEKE